ncbi:D-alanyl-D-alanine carboxypeptidase family protein [Aquibacillus koreensis]|uniref:D-alanyl-D-alanine carboxypeptidase family protein n=1 Tax=Aquibacillus koreensis TaxID=279446 RepID=A0A9X3WGE7_9BACI|nr:D-alanyl-D-alanine carboxypeptidase family protein [Aquibacillus koreensis]MCT2536530.1 D-alanyl-D-alanine carboxypeptidase family protein [Aquibacillus koreensis]MDC3419382.1 D-alanyl-D-alanine carboxypeptidase family protein [Aquibacillus koreensis]
MRIGQVVFILCFLIVTLGGCSGGNEEPPSDDQKNADQDQSTDHQNGQSDSGEEDDQDQDNTLEKAEIERLNQGFRESIVQATDDDQKVKNYASKDELIEDVTKYADQALAKEYVDLYYKEENGNLYLIPKEGPVLLQEEVPYEFGENEDGEYYVSQEDEDALRGSYYFYMTFTQKQDGWVIQDIKLDFEEDHVDEDVPDQPEEEDQEEPDQEQEEAGDDQHTNEEVVYSPKQIQQEGKLILVNKTHKLPADYVPEELVIPDVDFSFEEDLPKKQMRQIAAQALENMFAAASKEEITLYAVSGYRSFDRQDIIFNYNANQHGEAYANQFSARPGESEHQTGLTMDVTSRSVNFGLIQRFGETEEGKWVKANAHKYGFVVRYPEDKQHITGYTYEPWHLRYVGNEVATEMFEREITFEEFLGVVKANG